MLSELDWKGFEDLVFAIQRLRHEHAIVTLDAKLRDVITGHLRQVDILIERSAEGKPSRFVVECKHYKTRRVTQPDVEQFVSFLKSVDASGGAMVASGGYSNAAKLYADAMDVGLFGFTEASALEWNAYLNSALETKIKKRLISGDIALLTDRGTIEVRSGLLSTATTMLQLFGNLDGEYLPVTELRKRVPSIDVNFFLHMPTLLGFTTRWVEGQVEDKLWGSKQIEYEALAAPQRNSGDGIIHSLITHQVYDSMSLAKKDVGASLTWESYLEAKLSGDMAPLYHRFLRLGGDFVRIQAAQLMYRAELTSARFYKDYEVSELDLRQGIVYVDVLNDAKTFYLPVDLQGVGNWQATRHVAIQPQQSNER